MDLLISEEDVEAGACFPEARDWLDIGRRRVRHQIERLDGRLRKYGKTLTFPLETSEAWYVLHALGYRADRKSFDDCVRHGHLEPPATQQQLRDWAGEQLAKLDEIASKAEITLADRQLVEAFVQRIEIEPDTNTGTIIMFADLQSAFASTRVVGGDCTTTGDYFTVTFHCPP